MSRYTAVAERSGNWWAISVEEVAGVFTQARRLDQVEAQVRDALALFLGVPANSFEVVLEPKMPVAVGALLTDLHQEQATLARAQTRSSRLLRELVEQLTVREGLSTRDAAALMGISYQRVAQLTKS